jgi:hypothetical protein
VTSAYRYARTYLRMFSNLNDMVHVFLFNMKIGNVIMNVMMYVMCRKILELLGKTKLSNDGQPQVEDKCKKVVVERLLKGLWSSHEAPLMR